MFKYVLLALVVLTEFVYVWARRKKRHLRTKAQTRARWFAQLVFAHIALQKPLTLVLSGFFVWARSVHLIVPNKWGRNILWLCGLGILLTPLFLDQGRDFHLYAVLAGEMVGSSLWLCFCQRHSHEFTHLAWGHGWYLLFLLPAAISGDLVPLDVLNDVVVPIGLFLLYLRMRTIGLMGNKKMGTGDIRLDYANIFEALEDHRATRLYLSKIDPGVRDIYDSLDRDCIQVLAGNLKSPMPSSGYHVALENLGIKYRENNLFKVRDELIMYIHREYDKKRVLRNLREFVFPSCTRREFEELPTDSSSRSSSGHGITLEESSHDSFLDYSADSGQSDGSEIVYAELQDFSSGAAAISQDSA